MPKNTDATKSKMRVKLTRKPLRDVSNAKIATKSANVSKAISKDDGEQAGGDLLDHLLLVHSDISSLLRQIDELIVQALQSPSNRGRKEMKQFADVLSEMQTSLKPWVPRFQKALLSQSSGPENISAQPIGRTVSCVPKESTDAVVESPEETKWESLVSPSPLVSWRAECNTEGGRQLFLLTPLPQRKAFSSKIQASSLPALENVTSYDITHTVPICDSVGNLGNDLSKGVSVKSNRDMDFNIEVTEDVDNHRTHCASPEKFSNTSCSLFLMTPCLKMSPPKSCKLLEPISEFSMNKTRGVQRCTPYPVGVKNSSQDSEFSSGQSSDDLKLKYPELYGIKTENMPKRMVEKDSPNWIVSPPKTCIIMEPSDERQEYQDDHAITTNIELHNIIGALGLTERTPLMKEPMSSFRKGKHPGENTLKKELWTKFEAASTTTDGFCFNSSLLQTTIKKGFLDQLDEASDA